MRFEGVSCLCTVSANSYPVCEKFCCCDAQFQLGMYASAKLQWERCVTVLIKVRCMGYGAC